MARRTPQQLRDALGLNNDTPNADVERLAVLEDIRELLEQIRDKQTA